MTPEPLATKHLFPRLVRFDQPASTATPLATPAKHDPAPNGPLTSEEISRLYLWQRALEERQVALDRRAAEVDKRFEQVVADATELETQVKLAAIDEARRHAEAERLHRLRVELENRQSTDAARAEVIDSQQAKFAVVKARLDRNHLEQQREAQALATEQAALAAARMELDEKLREAESLRIEFGTLKTGTEAERQALQERQSLFNSQLEELNRQRDTIQAEAERLAAKEQDLDIRSAELAEQTAVMKAKVTQIMEYHARLDADRAAVRDRETTLFEAEDTRQSLQEQLRKRSEELAARARSYDDQFRKLADERQALDTQREELTLERVRVAEELLHQEKNLEERERQVRGRMEELGSREVALTRQVARLREVGAAVAAERKALATDKDTFAQQRANFADVHNQAAGQLEQLRQQGPALQQETQATLERLAQAREMLRGQLAELHAFAGQGREELDAARDDLQKREAHLETAKAEHRHTVAAFRQQVAEWQAKLAGARTTTSQAEARAEIQQTTANDSTRKAEEAQRELARQQDMLRAERARLAERRSEVERHLGDLREWYRHKMRELAASAKVDDSHTGPALLPAKAEPEPGDKQLGDVLRAHHFIDAETLQKLWVEARHQRRTLRQVLLSSGTITLYQLALIEAGNLDALVLGRFRLIDRLRATPRESVFRVYDPFHAGDALRAMPLLRVLTDAEMQDAVHPDEFRQRFASLSRAQDEHLALTWDVLDVGGRPAAIQEYVVGLPGGDWPGVAPGVWLKLVTGTAAGLAALHRVGLVHGRLASDSVILTAQGMVKVLDGGLPDWLAGPARGATEAQDLRMLGQLAHTWALRAPSNASKTRRPRAFPEPLLAVARRLEADGSNPMADEVPVAHTYRDTDDLLADLHRLAAAYPCPPEEWAAIVALAVAHSAESQPLRKAG